MRRFDLAGQRFGKLTVLRKGRKPGASKSYWVCRCDCGGETLSRSDSLTAGTALSCGCVTKAARLEAVTKHGLSDHPLYHTWQNMVRRCADPKSKSYPDYGGRGITVCNEWALEPGRFIEWSEAHGWQSGLELDRRNNDLGYSPGNCRFVTRKRNANNKRSNRRLVVGGETLCMADAARRYGLRRQTVAEKLDQGWSGDEIVRRYGRVAAS